MHYRAITAVAALLMAMALSASGISAAKEAARSVTKQPATAQNKTGQNKSAKKPKPVDINSASAAQLKTVPGIGDAEAERIIKARPYPTRSHLVTKNVLTYDAYLALKDRIVAVPPTPPKGKK